MIINMEFDVVCYLFLNNIKKIFQKLKMQNKNNARMYLQLLEDVLTISLYFNLSENNVF
jgi:hypothetical protein